MNKKEKGFTLIELLAVLAIMAAILLVAVPSITKQLSSIEESKYNQFKQNIFLAADTYISSNPDNKTFEELKNNNGSICINIETLIQSGWIKSTLKNPKTDKKINTYSSILVTNKNGTYEYKYQPDSSCS
jgi:type IV pilus assembly protein PilA